MGTLYHFTALANLPAILDEGITRGEFPDPKKPYRERPQWPNLTNVRNPQKHSYWNEAGFDKTRVRLEVETDGLTIRSFDELSLEHDFPAAYIKALAPHGENRTWFHSIGPIPVSAIVGTEIALEEPFKFRRIRDDHLAALCQHIEQHRIEHITYSDDPGGRMKFNLPTTGKECWLLDSADFRVNPSGSYRPLPKNWRKPL